MIIKSIPENIQLSKDLSKTCPSRFPGAQSASLHPELPQGVLKVSSCSSTRFNVHRGRWQIPHCPVIRNALGNCQFVVQFSSIQLLSRVLLPATP